MSGTHIWLCVLAGLMISPVQARSADIDELVGGTAHQALFAIDMDGQLGLAVGAAGEVLGSKDGGKSWQQAEPRPTGLALLGVAVASGHAIAVGQQGLALVSAPPAAWTQVATGTKERLFAVRMNAKGQAVAVGAFGTILRSDDSGLHWQQTAPDWSQYTSDGEQPHIYDAAIDSQGVMTVAGEFGLILRSADGHDWKALHKGSSSIFAIQLRPDGVGFAVGQSGTILKTTDAGATWSAAASPTSAILLGVASDSDGHVAVTGMHDMLTSADDGGHWNSVANRRFASAWYQGIANMPATHDVLIVGHSGDILAMRP